MSEPIEIRKGERFGYLEVINQGDSDKRGAARYWCRCHAPDCPRHGERVLVMSLRLRQGRTRSCGCLRALMRRQERAEARQLQAEADGLTEIVND